MANVSPLGALAAIGHTQAPQPATVAQLKALIHRGALVFDSQTNISKGKIIDTDTGSALGDTRTDAIVRIGSGAAYSTSVVSGPTSAEGGVSSGNFADSRKWLVLDAVGIEYVA